MSTMIAEVYEALTSAGAPEGKAKAAASVILPKMETEARLDKIESWLRNIETRLAVIEKDIAVIKTLTYLYGPITIGLLIKIAFF